MSTTRTRIRVTWTEDGYSKTGTVVRDDRRYAWTPNDLTNEAPDTGMVRVHWDGDQALHWEYWAELVEVAA
ncbi:MAG: hypothetical protein INR66_18245 [Gordonia polyisoprenivorans]|nr:hypothetical protein [Gordonia polyisoprenivorans]